LRFNDFDTRLLRFMHPMKGRQKNIPISNILGNVKFPDTFNLSLWIIIVESTYNDNCISQIILRTYFYRFVGVIKPFLKRKSYRKMSLPIAGLE